MYAERIAEIVAFWRKSETRNTMMTSDLGAEGEMCRFVHAKRGREGEGMEGKRCGVPNVESLIHQCQNKKGREKRACINFR